MIRKTFTYDNGKGKVTQRDVLVVSPANDFMEAIDLTDYAEEDKELLADIASLIHRKFLNELKEAGLVDNWRRFKSKGMSNISEV